MNRFTFCGEVPASKSLLNRWLIVRDYAHSLQILGDSDAEDVRYMKDGLRKLHSDTPVNCGAAGTVLRFLCLRASRLPGRHVLFGTPRLMNRPHSDLTAILGQLGVTCRQTDSQIEIEGMGWQLPATVDLNPSQTSQFASALLLNAWNLEAPLTLKWPGTLVSEGYFQMTCGLVGLAGMSFRQEGSMVSVPARQTVKLHQAPIEADLSSTFSLAAIAAVAGTAEFENFPFLSLQPDLGFIDILERMNVRLELKPTSLIVHRSPHMRAIDAQLTNCPDLFPVLAVLCSCAEGTSRLFGAPQLRFKESDRIAKTSELLTLMGVPHETTSDGMHIEGRALADRQHQLKLVRSYDADQDHRLAMAAQLANWIGTKVNIEHREVVNKSFPAFWDLTEVGV